MSSFPQARHAHPAGSRPLSGWMMGIATAIALTAYPGLEGASQTKKLRVTSNFPNFSAGVSRLRRHGIYA
eukprot:1363863-Amorphochlora_amoeboformis.AAC.1